MLYWSPRPVTLLKALSGIYKLHVEACHDARHAESDKAQQRLDQCGSPTLILWCERGSTMDKLHLFRESECIGQCCRDNCHSHAFSVSCFQLSVVFHPADPYRLSVAGCRFNQACFIMNIITIALDATRIMLWSDVKRYAAAAGRLYVGRCKLCC